MTTGAACHNTDQDKTYKEVMFHCGSGGHNHSFAKTLGIVLQKVEVDLRHPEMVIKMMTG